MQPILVGASWGFFLLQTWDALRPGGLVGSWRAVYCSLTPHSHCTLTPAVHSLLTRTVHSKNPLLLSITNAGISLRLFLLCFLVVLLSNEFLSCIKKPFWLRQISSDAGGHCQGRG
jgi:hypothetical protein